MRGPGPTTTNLEAYLAAERRSQLFAPQALIVPLVIGLAVGVGSGYVPLWAIAAVAAVVTVVRFRLERRRYGARTHAEYLSKAMRDHMGNAVLRYLRKGQLDEKIGAEGAALFEACAAHAMRIRSDVAVMRHDKLTGTVGQEFAKELSSGVDAGMKYVFAAYEPALLSMGSRGRGDEEGVRRMEAALGELAEELAGWMQAVRAGGGAPDIASLRSRLKTMASMETGFREGRIELGASDLEAEARNRTSG